MQTTSLTLPRSNRAQLSGLLQEIAGWSDTLDIQTALNARDKLVLPSDSSHHQAYSRFGSKEHGLSAIEAADCILDVARTRRFVGAITTATEKLLEKRTGIIEVLDVGCGPTAILSLAAAAQSDRVHVTALELNKYSAELAEKAIARFGLSKQVRVLNVDAQQYDDRKQYDLLMTETFDSGMRNELGLEFLRKFAPQVATDGFIIPDTVSVFAACKAVQQSGVYSSINPTTMSWHSVLRQHVTPGLDTESPSYKSLQGFTPQGSMNDVFLSSGLYFPEQLSVSPLDPHTVSVQTSLITVPTQIGEVSKDGFIDNVTRLIERSKFLANF